MVKPSGVNTLEDSGAGPRPSRPPPPVQYEDIEELKSADGILGIISQHRANGVLTFTILREYEHFGQYKRTSFFPETMLPGYLAMVKLVSEKLSALLATMPPMHERKPVRQNRKGRR